jgi:formate/nitrite transporter FocA (FNT family)
MNPSDPAGPPLHPALDALLPDAMARKAEDAGIAKAHRDTLRLLALSVLAGAFIAFGAMLATVAIGGSAEDFAALAPGPIGADLFSVTLGNFVGGALVVGILYWFIYLRRS